MWLVQKEVKKNLDSHSIEATFMKYSENQNLIDLWQFRAKGL